MLITHPRPADWHAGSLTLLPRDPSPDDPAPGPAPRLAATLQRRAWSLQAFADEVVRHELPHLRPLGEDQERVLLREAIDEQHRAGRLGRYEPVREMRGFFDSALGTLRELRAAGVTLAWLEAHLAEAPAHLRPALALAREWERRKEAHGRAAPEDRLREAATLWAQGRRGPFAGLARIDASGFVDPTPLEAALLAALGVPPEAWQPPEPRPAGVAHLLRALADPTLAPEADAAGLDCIEAPGILGEVRLAARAVAEAVRRGQDPARVVLTARPLERYAALVREVFAEYQLPVRDAGRLPLRHDPSCRTLLRAARLGVEDFPFRGTTALLRNRLFRPQFAGRAGDPALPCRAESLLRRLGETRGSERVLKAVRVWCDSPPPLLEDEGAERFRREQLQQLARECRPFLEEFYACWGRLPARATPQAWVRGLRSFANTLGLAATADTAGWPLLWELLDQWAARPHLGGRRGASLDLEAFLRTLEVLGDSPVLPVSQSHPRGVRLLAPEEAIHAPCEWLLILGMGEGNFPRSGGVASLLGERERQCLTTPHPLETRQRRQGREQSLLRQLLALPTQRLTLAYPAVDPRGQALLPGPTYLLARAAFEPGAIPTTHRRMLIEGVATQAPLSEAEYRVQFAIWLAGQGREAPPWEMAALPGSVVRQLRAAQQLVVARFHGEEFGAHEGWLTHPAVHERLALRFDPARPISATALESYIYCPFRFLVEQVLRLEELAEPEEEIEQTRRGAAVHRALARFHQRLQDGVLELTPGLPGYEPTQELLKAAIDEVVREYADRTPGPAARVLWELEGRRLQRQMGHYLGQWDEFLGTWRPHGLDPRPRHLEEGFGLPDARPDAPLVVRVGGVEVRLNGRIDRVDVVDLEWGKGFWVIDYKTGREANYTAADLENLHKLQLPLYAMAVEQLLFPHGEARPLGLLYWMATDSGPRAAMGCGRHLPWLADPHVWPRVRQRLEAWVAELVRNIRAGSFPLAPRLEDCTKQCDLSPVCRISQARGVGKAWEPIRPALEPLGIPGERR